MKNSLSYLTILATLSLQAKTIDYPVYGYAIKNDGIHLQVPTCKKRDSKIEDIYCTAKTSQLQEEGTGNQIKNLLVSCEATSEEVWCEVGDKHIAFGKEFIIPFSSITVKHPGDPDTSGDEEISEGYQVKYVGKIKATPSTDTLIEIP